QTGCTSAGCTSSNAAPSPPEKLARYLLFQSVSEANAFRRWYEEEAGSVTLHYNRRLGCRTMDASIRLCRTLTLHQVLLAVRAQELREESTLTGETRVENDTTTTDHVSSVSGLPSAPGGAGSVTPAPSPEQGSSTENVVAVSEAGVGGVLKRETSSSANSSTATTGGNGKCNKSAWWSLSAATAVVR
ncbi:unnamed protein product, partial [Amoebophrya sp. A25]